MKIKAVSKISQRISIIFLHCNPSCVDYHSLVLMPFFLRIMPRVVVFVLSFKAHLLLTCMLLSISGETKGNSWSVTWKSSSTTSSELRYIDMRSYIAFFCPFLVWILLKTHRINCTSCLAVFRGACFLLRFLSSLWLSSLRTPPFHMKVTHEHLRKLFYFYNWSLAESVAVSC